MTDPQDTTPNAVGDDRAGYPPYRRWVKALAVALVVTTFMLLALGGQVTSEEAGMAVPDGFTTFGTWSLIAPLETWWHQMDTRLEHTHRLMGYVVGILAIGLMVSLLMTQGPRLWVKLLGIGVLLGVIGQGLLGILRVDEVSLFLAGVHGVTGQLFLCLTVLAAAAVGRFWMTRPTHRDTDRHRRCLRVLPIVLLVMLFLQLGLGSAVRHGGAALAIPDWPTHYGSLVPPMDQTHIDQAVAALPADAKAPRFDPDGDGTYQAWQVHLHFTHRLGAYLIAGFGLWFVAFLWRSFPGQSRVLVPAGLFAILLGLQVMLGVITIWSGERPLIATAHQSCGAALLATAAWLTIRLHLVPPPQSRPSNVPVAAGDATTEKFRSDAGQSIETQPA